MKLNAVAIAVALTVSALASSASAATIVGATSVRITSAIPTWLQVAEFRAIDFSNANVALTATATASGKYSDFYFPPGTADDGPENAIDNVSTNPFGYAQAYAGPGYPGSAGIFHSETDSGSAFLLITFAGPVTLKGLEIYGRTDNGGGSRDWYNVDIRAGSSTLFNGMVDARNDAHFGALSFGAVPEPASWALMISGFGLAGAALRRRRSALAA